MPWVDGSGDPFGILATVIPIFFLTLYFGGINLRATTPAAARGEWLTILALGVGEVGAIYGLVFGGPVLLVLIIALIAVFGLSLVVMHAMFAVQPQSAQDRRARLAAEHIRRDLAEHPPPDESQPREG